MRAVFLSVPVSLMGVWSRSEGRAVLMEVWPERPGSVLYDFQRRPPENLISEQLLPILSAETATEKKRGGGVSPEPETWESVSDTGSTRRSDT